MAMLNDSGKVDVMVNAANFLGNSFVAGPNGDGYQILLTVQYPKSADDVPGLIYMAFGQPANLENETAGYRVWVSEIDRTPAAQPQRVTVYWAITQT